MKITERINEKLIIHSLSKRHESLMELPVNLQAAAGPAAAGPHSGHRGTRAEPKTPPPRKEHARVQAPVNPLRVGLYKYINNIKPGTH